jgi:DNA helicase-2/ATP-dependent DNA helicase PcrA
VGKVRVSVRRAGQVIRDIERPLRDALGGPAVVYQDRFWRVLDGSIDLDSQPLEIDRSAQAPGFLEAPPRQSAPLSAPTPAAPVAPNPTRLPLPPIAPVEIVDDSAERAEILGADAASRMLVEAGPGTGKTQLAALRLSRLISSELSPGQVLVLSFSRSAVRTLTRRLAEVAKADDRIMEELRHISIRTFDSWTFRMLRLLGEQPATLMARPHDENIAALTEAIGGSRREAVRALIGDRRHLIVDEFQDLPGVRGELVLALLDLLCPPGETGCGFTILGDPAQAIFGFAARNSKRTWPTPQQYWDRVQQGRESELLVKTLRRNYRAEAPLAALSAELRSVLLGALSVEEKLRIIRERIADLPQPASPPDPSWLAPSSGSQAILTRSNGEALSILQKLVGTGEDGPATPVRLRAGSFAGSPPAWIGGLLRKVKSPSVTRTQFDAIHAHLTKLWDDDVRRQLSLPPSDVAWMRLASASGAAEDDTVFAISALRGRFGWPDAFPDDQPLLEEGMIVTTIHQSKGMEFDIVTVLESTRQSSGNEGEDEDEDEDEVALLEEASVAYVAVTRAARELRAIPASAAPRPPASKDFGHGRKRLRYWRNTRVNLEMGIRGDIDPTGFVDPAFLGGAEGVENLQQHFLENALDLEGRKVVLCRQFVDGKARYDIHLQVNSEPDRLIGRMAPQLCFDLLALLHGKGYSLPSRIHNLRIAGVGTVTSESEILLEDPDRTSRLWLGVSLFGTGDFSPRKKKA